MKRKNQANKHSCSKRAFTPPEAAVYVGHSESYLDECRWGRCGPGPRYIKNGRKVIYLLEDLDAWLDNLKKTA